MYPMQQYILILVKNFDDVVISIKTENDSLSHDESSDLEDSVEDVY